MDTHILLHTPDLDDALGTVSANTVSPTGMVEYHLLCEGSSGFRPWEAHHPVGCRSHTSMSLAREQPGRGREKGLGGGKDSQQDP